MAAGNVGHDNIEFELNGRRWTATLTVGGNVFTGTGSSMEKAAAAARNRAKKAGKL